MKVDYLKSLLRNAGDEPDRIQQLRKLIVALAVSGKLGVNQRSHDLPSVRPDALPAYFEEMAGFTILSAVARIEKGRTGIKQAVPGEYPLVVTAAERSPCDHFDFEGPAAIVPLVSSTGHGKASLHRLHYQEGKFALGTILAAIFPLDASLISARFIFEYLSAYKEELLVSRMIGTANVSLSVGKIAEVPIPLVSLDVQAKVDELMVLCDQLEAARTEREATRDRLAAASLARINAPNPDTFTADARFALDALPSLTERADQIKQFRQTILSLAVRGRLVEQDSAEEPASNLLLEISRRRKALFDDGYPNAIEARAQRNKQEQQALPEELPKLPIGWSWSTLMQCSLFVIDCKNKTAPYASSGIRLIRTTNVRDGRLNANDQKFVDERTYEDWSLRAKPQAGDLLITREAPMGEVCLIPEGERVCLGQRMMMARLVPGTIAPRFLLYSLMDPFLMERVQDKPLGMTVQHLRVGGVETLLVPLPPLAEQHRIVAKVDELMALCGQLEAGLASVDDTRRRLLDALLAEALQPALQAAA